MTTTPRLRRASAAIAASALLLGACGSDDEETSTTNSQDTAGESATDEAATGGSAGTSAPSEEPANFAGQTVTIMGAFTEGQEADFIESVKSWEERTGATVAYEGTGELRTLLTSRVEGGNPPDIAILPQPGLMADFARTGDLKDLSTVLDVDQIQQELIPGLYDLGVVDGTYYGYMYTVSIDSLEWYSPTVFTERGYEVPATWEELVELTARIREDASDGSAPWCMGIESGEFSGWPVSQWIEDLMLRTAGPEKYDAWVSGELPFSSPEVTRAAEMFAELMLDFDNVYGGQSTMLTVGAGDDALPMLEDPPGCFLNRQGSWMTGVFADAGAEMGTDIDVFAVPELADGGFDGLPVMGAGDLAVLMTDNPAAAEFMRFMATQEAIEPRVDAGYVFSPLRDFPTDAYPAGILRKQAEILAQADTFRFDGSDQMEAQRSAAFLTEMVRWVNGEAPLEEILANIDAAAG